MVACKNVDPNAEEVPVKLPDDAGRDRYNPAIVLDLQYVALIPKRAVAM
jgi:hypothetical protein